MLEAIRALLSVPAADRGASLDQWFSEAPEKEQAARALSDALQGMAGRPWKHPDSNADDELTYFLDAEKVWHTLDTASESCDETPELKARLSALASTSALLSGESADTPYNLARQAVRADPSCDEAWQAFEDSLHAHPDDVFGDIEDWRREAADGEAPPELARRALERAKKVAAESWKQADRDRLAELEA